MHPYLSMKTITTLKIAVLAACIFSSTVVCAQRGKKAPPTPLTHDGYHSVANTSKSKIFNELLKEEQKLSGKRESTILLADSVKGILNVKRTAHCDYTADTTFNGKILKNAVTKHVPYTYTINFKIDNNIFTYKILGFYTQAGQQIMKNDVKNADLSSCAQREIWSFSDQLSAAVVLMSYKY